MRRTLRLYASDEFRVPSYRTSAPRQNDNVLDRLFLSSTSSRKLAHEPGDNGSFA